MELAIIEAVEAAEAADKQKVTCYVCDKKFKTLNCEPLTALVDKNTCEADISTNKQGN